MNKTIFTTLALALLGLKLSAAPPNPWPPMNDNAALRSIGRLLQDEGVTTTPAAGSVSAVTGVVGIAGTPAVTISGTPAVTVGGTSSVSIAGSPLFTPYFATGGAGWTNCDVGVTNPLPSVTCREIVLLNDSTNYPTLLVFRTGVRVKIGAGFGIPIKGLTNANEISISSETLTNDYVPFFWYN